MKSRQASTTCKAEFLSPMLQKPEGIDLKRNIVSISEAELKWTTGGVSLGGLNELTYIRAEYRIVRRTKELAFAGEGRRRGRAAILAGPHRVIQGLC